MTNDNEQVELLLPSSEGQQLVKAIQEWIDEAIWEAMIGKPGRILMERKGE